MRLSRRIEISTFPIGMDSSCLGGYKIWVCYAKIPPPFSGEGLYAEM